MNESITPHPIDATRELTFSDYLYAATQDLLKHPDYDPFRATRINLAFFEALQLIRNHDAKLQGILTAQITFGRITRHAATYAGFYQALAHAEGANGSTKIHVPDELYDQSTNEYFDFNLLDFFAIVADFDDSGIHYFTFTNEPLANWPDIKPLTLTIYCTDSDYWYDAGDDDDPTFGESLTDALTSHGWLALHDALKGT